MALFVYVYSLLLLILSVPDYSTSQSSEDACSYPSRQTFVLSLCSQPCRNGDCEITETTPERVKFGCVCDPGWAGPSCDICCDSISCIPGQGTCNVIEGTSAIYCQCLEGFKGVSCNETITPVMTLTTEALQPSIEPTTEVEICNGVPVDEEAHTSCFGDYCVHGDCVEFGSGDYFGLYCECEPGWIGYHCDMCCDLTCHDGECVAYEVGSKSYKYCQCNDPRMSAESNCTEFSTEYATRIPDLCGGVEFDRFRYSQCGEGYCEQGVCQFDTMHCACDPGFVGDHCDICCDIPCPRGNCSQDASTGDLRYCSCSNTEFTTQSNCTALPTSTLVPDNTTDSTVPSMAYCNGEPIQNQEHIDCFGDYCIHGSCKEVEDNSTGFVSSAYCVCDEGWTGYHCEVCCDLPCFNSTCVWFEHEGNITRYCVCDDPKLTTDSNCTLPLPTTPPPTQESVLPDKKMPEWLFIVVAFTTFLAFICILVVTIMKKDELRMRITYYFQKYETPEDHDYDVFISFANNSEDAAFTKNILLPKLESEMNFQACVLERDAMGGASIAETIIEAVTRSGRTILVISPDYCEGDWTHFQTEVAHKKSLVKRLGHTIIPVVFKDIADVDLNLLMGYILYTSKILVWPGAKEGVVDDIEQDASVEKFWRKLRMLMPKYKPKVLKNEQLKQNNTPEKLEVGLETAQPSNVTGDINGSAKPTSLTSTDSGMFDKCSVDIWNSCETGCNQPSTKTNVILSAPDPMNCNQDEGYFF